MWMLHPICFFVLCSIAYANAISVEHELHHGRNRHQETHLEVKHHVQVRHPKEHIKHEVKRKQHKTARHQPIKNFHPKDVKKRCIGPCDENNSTNAGAAGRPYILSYNSSAYLLSVSSDSSKVAILVDYNTGIALATDGNTGSSVLVDPHQNFIVFLSDNSQLVWQPSKQSFDDFFLTVASASLQDFVKNHLKDGQPIDDAGWEVGNLLITVLSGLGGKVPDSGKSAVTQLVDLTGRLSNNKKLLETIMNGSGKVVTQLCLKDLVCILEGLARLLRDIQSGSLPPIDLGRLLDASSGLEVLLNLLKQLVGHVDLVKVLGNGLESIEGFLSFAVKFSGDSSTGVDGIIKIVYNIVAFVENHGSASAVIQSFLQFFTNDGISFDRAHIVGVIRGIIAVFDIQNNSFPGSLIPHHITNFLERLEHDNLILKHISISRFINSFVHLRPLDALKNLISILIQLGIGIPQLFIHSIGLILNPSGQNALTNIIPNFDKTQIPNNTDPLHYILQHSNVSQAISSGCPLSEALQRIPVIGTIFAGISKAANQVSNGSNYLHPIFNQSNPGFSIFINQIQNYVNKLSSNGNSSTTGLLNVFKPIQSGLNNIIGDHGGDWLQNLTGHGGVSMESTSTVSIITETLPARTDNIPESSTSTNLGNITTDDGGSSTDTFLSRRLMRKNKKSL